MRILITSSGATRARAVAYAIAPAREVVHPVRRPSSPSARYVGVAVARAAVAVVMAANAVSARARRLARARAGSRRRDAVVTATRARGIDRRRARSGRRDGCIRRAERWRDGASSARGRGVFVVLKDDVVVKKDRVVVATDGRRCDHGCGTLPASMDMIPVGRVGHRYARRSARCTEACTRTVSLLVERIQRLVSPTAT